MLTSMQVYSDLFTFLKGKPDGVYKGPGMLLVGVPGYSCAAHVRCTALVTCHVCTHTFKFKTGAASGFFCCVAFGCDHVCRRCCQIPGALWPCSRTGWI